MQEYLEGSFAISQTFPVPTTAAMAAPAAGTMKAPAAGTSTVITKKRGKSMMDLPLFHAESSGYRRQAAYPLM
ncbi:MAG: hypothetical protein ACLRQY_08715 [[Clostridium] leptum]